jgi:RNA polymerase sigma factor (sigma-70 family)
MLNRDALLVERLKTGDEHAFREVVALYHEKIYNTCLSFVKQEDDADDLAQEVFIEVFRSIGKFRMASSISTWIYRIAVNKSLEYLRKRKVRSRFNRLFHGESSESNHQVDFVHPGVIEERKEYAARLFRAIDQLPDQQKTAFILHKIEGLSYDDIAAVMGKSMSSVQSLLHRARLGLQQSLRSLYQNSME